MPQEDATATARASKKREKAKENIREKEKEKGKKTRGSKVHSENGAGVSKKSTSDVVKKRKGQPQRLR
jgi:hypothetical protein